jgi:protein-S-isoprenylcysteine O-methyltransferase Ste14
MPISAGGSMNLEDPFRLALLAVLAPVVCVAVYHRWQARSSERLSRREEGIALAIVLRLSGLCLWVAIFAYLINPAWVDWAQLALPDWLRWSGLVVGAPCWFLMYWTLSNLGKNLTDTVVRRANATLVTTGPYRWVRHPFYTTVGTLLSAATLLTANWMIGVLSLLVLSLLVRRTDKEEQKLVEGFEGYRRYMATTGRFLPKLIGSRG